MCPGYHQVGVNGNESDEWIASVVANIIDTLVDLKKEQRPPTNTWLALLYVVTGHRKAPTWTMDR